MRCTVEYLGTAYAGFQRQREMVTVQEMLETAIEAVTGEPVTIAAAGRTDAGAHALHQVIAFDTVSRLPARTLQRAINAHLPRDIAVTKVSDVAADFHPRFDATGRTYRYLIWNSPTRSPLWTDRAAHIKRPLNVDAMRAAAGHLVGTHDFGAFVASGAPHSRVRRMARVDVWREGDLVTVELEATGFLKQMVRSIVGTLIEVGAGERDPGSVADILRSKDRARAGETAPACGLYLVNVHYPVSDRSSKETE